MLTRIAVCTSVCAFAIVAAADHGPGTSGGGSTTQSGETLNKGQWVFESRADYAEFERLSDVQIEARAMAVEHFDFLSRSFLTTVSVNYGMTNNAQVGLSLGYYAAVGARSAEFDGMDTEIATFNPDGLTDLWLTGKWRFHKSRAGHFALLGGVKFPTGRDRAFNSHGERVEPAAMAGTGAFDGLLGLAYSRWLTERITLDASAQYTIRGEAHDFKLGDRVDAGMAVAYRFVRAPERFPQVSVFAEATLRHLMRSQEDGEVEGNTGGTALFIGPGVKIGFCRYAALTVAAQLPALQALNGNQLETDYRILGVVTIFY